MGSDDGFGLTLRNPRPGQIGGWPRMTAGAMMMVVMMGQCLALLMTAPPAKAAAIITVVLVLQVLQVLQVRRISSAKTRLHRWWTRQEQRVMWVALPILPPSRCPSPESAREAEPPAEPVVAPRVADLALPLVDRAPRFGVPVESLVDALAANLRHDLGETICRQAVQQGSLAVVEAVMPVLVVVVVMSCCRRV